MNRTLRVVAVERHPGAADAVVTAAAATGLAMQPGDRRRAGAATASQAATLLAIGWGTLAFGAVYPWGYLTLALLAATAGALPLAIGDRRRGIFAAAGATRAVRLGLIAVAAVIALQLVPLPLSVIKILDPALVDLVSRLDLGFAQGAATHALSISPQETVRALMLFSAFALLLVGVAASCEYRGAARLIELLMALGALVALTGIVWRNPVNRQVYGFWATNEPGTPFGPFVNKNHFAGWMLMITPMSLGYCCAGIDEGMSHLRGWRSRLLWFSSVEANKLLLACGATAIMALSLMLTLSRAALIAFALSLAVAAALSLRRIDAPLRRIAVIGFLGVLVVGAIVLIGPDTIAARFVEPDWTQLNGRLGAWTDAVATFRRHWLTGIGADAYQTANVIYQQHDLASFADAAHNDYLQVAAEGGVVLLAAVAFVAAALGRDIGRGLAADGHRSLFWLRAGAVTGLLAIGVQECVDFSLQIPANAALFAAVCGVAVHRSPFAGIRRRTHQHPR